MTGRVDDGADGFDFESTVAAHLPVMLRVAAAFSSADHAPDIVQDALLVAWTNRGEFDRSRGSESAWLLGFVYNRARGRWRRRQVSLPLLEGDGMTPGPTEARVDVRRAIDRLPNRQRSIVVLHYYADMSVADIGSVLGCSTGTVKSTLADARKNLASTLGDSYART